MKAAHEKLGCKRDGEQGVSLCLSLPALITKTAHKKLGCKHDEQASSHHDHLMFYLSNSWPWDSAAHPNNTTKHKPSHPPSLTPPSAPTLSSSTSTYSLTSSSSRTSSPAAASPLQPFTTSLWDDDDDDDEDASPQAPLLPPVDPCDYMKTLLTQLSSCISSITTAYARQQAAIHSHTVQAATDVEHGYSTMAVISATDKAMVEALETLSGLHSQLVLLPHRLPFKELGADRKENSTVATTTLQLRRYEGIIARFHDEIWRKNAVTEALKETLAKSMLKGEKLQQRVKALEARLTQLETCPNY